jgi:hypothetical protein
MTSSFLLQLDTSTHVAAAINGGNSSTELEAVTLELDADADVIEMKVWGAINVLDPGAAGVAETEEAAEWQDFSPSLLVNLSPNPGPKTLHVRVRDDVWNEATAAASIVLGKEVAAPVRPRTPGWPTPPKRQRRSRQQPVKRLRSTTRLSVGPSSRGKDEARFLSEVSVRVPLPSYEVGAVGQAPAGRLEVATTVRRFAAIGHRAQIVVGTPEYSIKRGAIGPQMQATLEALEVL